MWVYERGTGRAFCTSTSNIAHENYFYALIDANGVIDIDSIEQFLANDVEGPANQIIDKLKMFQPITLDEKQQLARYVTYMYSRVPRYRERIKDSLPQIISERLSMLQNSSKLLKKGSLDPITNDDIDQRIEMVLKTAPDRLEQFLQLPHFYEPIYNVLMNMRWSFLVRQEPPYFLTSDNPFIFTEENGLGNEKAEIIFPLAKNVMLWATWKAKHKFIPITENIMEEVNKIVARNSTRFVFYCEDAEWVYKLV